MEPGRAREVASETLGAYRVRDSCIHEEAPTLFFLMPYLEGAERREAWGCALRGVKSIGSFNLPPVELLETLGQSELQELMEAIRESARYDSVGEPTNRPWLEIVPFLSEPERRDFLQAYPVIDDEGSRAGLLRAVLPFLDLRMHPEWSEMLREAARSFQRKPIGPGCWPRSCPILTVPTARPRWTKRSTRSCGSFALQTGSGS
jgi:hypothetical protein